MGKITAYSALTSPAAGDLLLAVDVSDTSMAPTGTDKKLALSDLGTFLVTRPYQFLPETYGAKGDGQLALVSVTNGSAVINTTPLGAPSAPALSNSGSGGSLSAGTYQVKITYVNQWGETVASTAASQAISGTQPLTISSPAPFRDATGWYAYCTTAGGSTFFRQQAPGSPTALNVALVLTANPGTSGANPPGSDTSAAQVFTSTGVDGGKNIMICGALGSPGGPWIDTISSVQSATQATLSTAGATATVAGCAMVFSTDDRLAIDSCMTAAGAYMLASNSFCQVLFADKIYGLGTSLFQSAPPSGTFTYNTQVRYPVGNPSGEGGKCESQLLGTGTGAACQFWASLNANMPGTALISYTIGPNSTPDPTFGQQSVVGGPTGGFASADAGFSNTKAVVKGITIVQPGWSNSIGLDLLAMCECELDVTSTVFAPSSALGGGVNPYSAWNAQSFWISNKIGAGVQLPAQSNNALIIGDVCVQGLNTGVLTQADHVILSRLSANTTDVVVKMGGGGGGQHDFAANINPENYNTGILTTGTGSKVMIDVLWDSETGAQNGGVDINDANSQLTGRLVWNDVNRSAGGIASVVAPLVTGAANLRVENGQLARQVYGAPTYTLGTAFQNPWWAGVWVQLAGGTVTNVQAGPTSAAATTSLATSTPVTFLLPAGWWLNITGSVKPTTFNAIPG